MKKLVTLFVGLALVTSVVFVTGYSILSSDNSEQVAQLKSIGKTAAQTLVMAYDSGGEEKITEKINEMVDSGKLTEDQASMIKSGLPIAITILRQVSASETTADNSNADASTVEEAAPAGEIQTE